MLVCPGAFTLAVDESSGAATMEEGRHGSWAAGGIGITPFLDVERFGGHV